MARPKGKKLVPKSTTTKRKCKTTRKRTKAKAIDEVVEIPPELLPKKESKWKKAAKIALGLAAGAGGAALGYYGYKNKDKIKKSANDASKKVKDLFDNATGKAKKAYRDAKYKVKSTYNDLYNKYDDWVYDKKQKYNDWRYGKENRTYPDRYSQPFKETYYGVYDPPAIEGGSDYFAPKFFITDGKINERIKKVPPPPPLALTSGREMDVVKELNNIRTDMKTTNRISSNYLSDVLREYQRQALNMDPFVYNDIRPYIDNILKEAADLESTNDENSIEKHKQEIEFHIDTLIGKFFKITRS